MTISKKLTLLVFVSTFFFVFSAFTGMWFNLKNQDQLHRYLNTMVARQNILLEVYRALGYGEGIHAFKDFILMHNIEEATKARKSFFKAKKLIIQYQNFSDVTQKEKQALETIKVTINLYLEKLLIAERLLKEDKNSREVINLIKINDFPAIEAIDNLQYYLLASKGHVETSILKTQERTFILMIISFFVIYLVRRMVGKKIINGVKKSIDQLISMADQIAIENKRVERPPLEHDEIGDLGDHLYDMSLKLEKNYYEINRAKSELEDLALITSKDLQEQLIKAEGILDILKEQEQESISVHGKQYIVEIKDHIFNMQQITLAFIAYSKVSSNEYIIGKVDLNKVVDNVVKGLNFGNHDFPIILNKDSLPKVRGEEKLLMMLLNILLSNAILYNEGQNELVINIQCQEIENNKVRIDITDNASKFNIDYSQPVLMPFEKLYGKLKVPGTGINLSICRKILSIHNSNFEIHGHSGRGTEVVFDLDLAE